MSRATNESLLYLALTAGVFSEIQRRNLISRVDLKTLIQESYDLAIQLINTWDETGDPKKNTQWMTKALNRWAQEAFTSGAPPQKVEALVAMADLVITDLIDKLTNPRKIKAIKALQSKIHTLMDFTDYNRERFTAFEESDQLLQLLYRISHET